LTAGTETAEDDGEQMANPRAFTHDSSALFDLSPSRPTTRTIARLVKERGVEGLPDAVTRGDDATYQEVTCRSALNRVEGMPFEWTLNPYRGCTHACHYCFARRYQTQFELDSSDQFSSVIFVKTNFVDVLRRELARQTWTRDLVAFGTATDPYQPIEGTYKLTRRSLEALRDARTPVGLITKGPLIVRDKDVLAELARVTDLTVTFSVPTVDAEAWTALEPGTAPPLQRLKAMRELVDAGIRAGVLMAPLVPGFTTDSAQLERTIEAIADHGAAFVGANLLHLEGGTRIHFETFLSKEYPALLATYESLYARKYAPKAYADPVYQRVELLKGRYGLLRRGPRPQITKDEAPAGTRPPASTHANGSFSWE
jgi:DNA repair photolyase